MSFIEKNKDYYILLSPTYFNARTGTSIPFMGCTSEGIQAVFLFENIECAKNYIDDNSFEKMGDTYLIGNISMKNDDLLHCLADLFLLGVQTVVYGVKTNEHIAYSIEEILCENNFSIEKKDNVQLKTMDTIDYVCPSISAARQQIIKRNVFEGGNTERELYNTFKENQTMDECCFVYDYLNSVMIPMAEQKDPSHVEYFNSVKRILANAIYDKVRDQKVYFLMDPETNQIVVKDNYLYVVYTNLYKNLGKYIYVPVEDRKMFLDVTSKTGVRGFAITDGPNYMVPIEMNLLL